MDIALTSRQERIHAIGMYMKRWSTDSRFDEPFRGRSVSSGRFGSTSGDIAAHASLSRTTMSKSGLYQPENPKRNASEPWPPGHCLGAQFSRTSKSDPGWATDVAGTGARDGL
jgi:hypothetical protein